MTSPTLAMPTDIKLHPFRLSLPSLEGVKMEY
ncbi:hypothetical protein HDF12_002208 [Edaphobacter lichenicola]|uniref:Uncharacterized protein n=2 Tax=Tunturiibacter TaxID=3154218 RepID=A0A7Y9NM23_9BACT|nr:hypothetical protein [Edaphobacter lichenicola]NYF51843.1 hypothetical protein [Edaphobacter lichenicola]